MILETIRDQTASKFGSRHDQWRSSYTSIMCGRYRLTRADKELMAEFGLAPGDVENEIVWAPRYNIAPTDVLPVIEMDANREMHFRLKRWGLIPFWAKDAKIGASMINARSETVLEKPALAESFRKHRVLVPADGFYEWKKKPGIDSKRGSRSKIVRQPYNFGMKDDSTFCFAGIAAKWKSPTNDVIESFSILTTDANKLVEDTHDRMPVILPKSQYKRWLTTEPERAEQLLELLVPFDATEMKKYAVNPAVNNVKNDSPQCIESFSDEAPEKPKEDVGQRKLFG
jgi:putative SOS response-associated peptidase YedK